MTKKVFAGMWAVAVAIMLSAMPAQADFIGPFVAIQVSNGSSSATFESILPPPAADQAAWALEQALELRGGPDNELIATIDSLSVSLDGDPVASINFSLTAGGSDVTATVSSATVAFAALNNPPASAEAEVTLTDNGGAAATISTTGANSGLFQAIFNGSSTFAELLGDSSVGGGSLTFSEGPVNGVIAGNVSSIQAKFAFELSAGDSAEGTGTFTVVPEPATLALLSMGCLAMLRRR